MGKKVSDAVKLWQFSFLAKAQPIVFKKGGKTLVAPPQVETEPKLTDAGYALAADMGLLVARLLLEACGGRVRRMLVTKPKREMSYHLPVLTGFGRMTLDPIQASIAQTYGVLSGHRRPEVWQEIFSIWKKMCEEAQGEVA